MCKAVGIETFLNQYFSQVHMAILRKANCYRDIKRAYTRKSKFKKKGYVKAVPNSRVVKFQMGDSKKDFPKKVKLVSKTNFQIRHNSIESCRQIINRNLSTKLGPKGYFFQLNLFPHHILRENKMLSGAHADRLQTGMKHAFGKTVGTAAQIKRGKTVFTVHVEEKDVLIAKASLLKATPRLAGKMEIVFA